MHSKGLFFVSLLVVKRAHALNSGHCLGLVLGRGKRMLQGALLLPATTSHADHLLSSSLNQRLRGWCKHCGGTPFPGDSRDGSPPAGEGSAGEEERNAIPVLGRAAESCPMAVSHRESQQGVGTVGGWRVWEAGDSRSLADGHESAPPGRGSGVSVAADWPVAPESARRVRSCWRRKRVTSLVWKQSQREKMW